MHVHDIRRVNVERLVFQYGNQTKLASAFRDVPFTQRDISYVVRKERGVTDSDARQIESRLVIPPFWIDRTNMIKDGWSEIESYRALPSATRMIVAKFMEFVLTQPYFDNKERMQRLIAGARQRVSAAADRQSSQST